MWMLDDMYRTYRFSFPKHKIRDLAWSRMVGSGQINRHFSDAFVMETIKAYCMYLVDLSGCQPEYYLEQGKPGTGTVVMIFVFRD